MVDAAAAALCCDDELHRGLTPDDGAFESFRQAWLSRFGFDAGPNWGTGTLIEEVGALQLSM
jgi:hypothetical protein